MLSRDNHDTVSFSQGAVKVGGTHPFIKRHIAELLETDALDYYQPVGGIYSLRAKLACDLSEKYGVSISPEEILVSHGAIGGITAVALSLLGEGDEVILPEPTYPSYRNIVLFSKAIPVFLPAFRMEKEKWTFDPEVIISKTTEKTKMIILSNPSNPCGVCLAEESLSFLEQWCEKKGIFLLLDEVYDNYIYQGRFHSGTPLVAKSEVVIRTGSFSKDFAMSGWRIGYIVAPRKLIQNFAAIQDGTLCCPSVIGQHAALFALQHKALIEETVNKVKMALDFTLQYLTPLAKDGVLSFVRPQAGIFLFVKTLEADSELFVRELLQQARVAVVPGKDFGESKETHSYFRLCFAREQSEIWKGMDRLLTFICNK